MCSEKTNSVTNLTTNYWLAEFFNLPKVLSRLLYLSVVGTYLDGTLVLVVDVNDVPCQSRDLTLFVKLQEVGHDLNVAVMDLVVLQDLFDLRGKK